VKYYFADTTHYDIEGLFRSLESGYNHIIDCFIIAANPKAGKKFLEYFSQEFIAKSSIVLWNNYTFVSEDYSELRGLYKGLGGDRVAKLVGALKMFPNKNIMLMDFGTATTLNLATSDYKFQGGFVNLGLQASVEAIYEKLKGFPNYTETEAYKSLVAGVNLREIFAEESAAKAVIEGAYREHLAMIQYYKQYAAEKFNGEKFISIATGGNAKLFAKEFDKSVDSRELLESFVDSLIEA
jgi:pantothenate kinase type III